MISDRTRSYLIDEGFVDAVDDWRLNALLAAGYPDEMALRLAANHDVDLHVACELLANGCSPELAERIAS